MMGRLRDGVGRTLGVGVTTGGGATSAGFEAAAERGVEVLSLSRYWRGREQWPGLILGFAAVDVKEIRRGVRQLAAALPKRRARR